MIEIAPQYKFKKNRLENVFYELESYNREILKS